jgi:hypothetical protein
MKENEVKSEAARKRTTERRTKERDWQERGDMNGNERKMR